MTSPNNGDEPMQVSAARIGVDDLNERTEELSMGSGTICLAGKNQMVVGESVLVRGLWDEAGDICTIQLELKCASDQLLILRQLNVIPSNAPVEEGPNLTVFFEMDPDRVKEDVLSELGDAQSIAHLFLAEDRFPPILNLSHYELQHLEIKHSL